MIVYSSIQYCTDNVGNEGRTKVHDRLREFTWNFGTLGQGYESVTFTARTGTSFAGSLHFTTAKLTAQTDVYRK